MCQPQSLEAHRSSWDGLVARLPTAGTLALPIRLCQAGAGQFSSAPKSATRYGLGSCGRACHEDCARHFRRAGLPPHRLHAGNRGVIGRGKLEERANHQCRVGRLQFVSASTTRWRTHRRRGAPGRSLPPACPARALRDANPHRSLLHPADAGYAIRSRSQHRLANNRKFDRRNHRRHTPIDWQHMTAAPFRRRGAGELTP